MKKALESQVDHGVSCEVVLLEITRILGMILKCNILRCRYEGRNFSPARDSHAYYKAVLSIRTLQKHSHKTAN